MTIRSKKMKIIEEVFKVILILLLFVIFSNGYAQKPFFHSEIIIPFQDEHVHGSSIEQLPNGDLLVAWFQGSGERWADDVKIFGSRKKYGSDQWSAPFVLADVEGFPDINPVLFVDGKSRLWLMWYTVIANQWETSLCKYRIGEDYMNMLGAPNWNWQENLHVKPGDKAERGIQPDDSFVQSVKRQLEEYVEQAEIDANNEEVRQWRKRTLAKARGEDMMRSGRIYKEDGAYESASLGYPYFRRMGWQTRNKPFITDEGRLIVPLYSDGFSFSLMAYTDNWGKTWEFSTPLVGGGNIQPTIAETGSGELVAYMRDNGPPPKRLHVSRSTDDGETWSLVQDSQLPNPGSAADIMTLENGNWVLVYNDTESGRHSLAVSLSEDEGSTWPWTRRLEFDKSEEPVTGGYPAIIQGKKGNLHVTYSYQLSKKNNEEQKTIKYVTFNEEWIKKE